MRTLLITFSALIIGFFLSYLITVGLNPEVKFWEDLMSHKDRELEKMQGERVIFAGDSSCTFSVDPTVVGEHMNRDCYNYGGSAFMGPKFMFERVKPHLRSGDTLVISYIPKILFGLDGGKDFPLGKRMALRSKNYEMMKILSHKREPLRDWMQTIRPGMRTSLVFIARKFSKGRPYAYTLDDYRPLGRLELSVTASRSKAVEKFDLIYPDESGEEFLKEVVKHCEEIGVEVYYSMSWEGTRPEVMNENRESRQYFLNRIEPFMSIIPDESLGVLEGFDGFSDTEMHMGPKLSKKRSLFLGETLKSILK